MGITVHILNTFFREGLHSLAKKVTETHIQMYKEWKKIAWDKSSDPANILTSAGMKRELRVIVSVETLQTQSDAASTNLISDSCGWWEFPKLFDHPTAIWIRFKFVEKTVCVISPFSYFTWCSKSNQTLYAILSFYFLLCGCNLLCVKWKYIYAQYNFKTILDLIAFDLISKQNTLKKNIVF